MNLSLKEKQKIILDQQQTILKQSELIKNQQEKIIELNNQIKELKMGIIPNSSNEALSSQEIAARTSCHCSLHGHTLHRPGEKDVSNEEKGQNNQSSQHEDCDGGSCAFMRADSFKTTNFLAGQNSFATVSPRTAIIPSECINTAESNLQWRYEPIPIHLANQALLL